MLLHAVRALAASRLVDHIVVAAPPEDVEGVRGIVGHLEGVQLSVVSGGETRQESVARALIGLGPEIDVVLVHDAARPLVPVELVDAVIAAVRNGAAAVVPGLPLTDTVKTVDDGVAGPPRVSGTPDRATLRAIQTPQGFRRETLRSAHAMVDPDDPAQTDDAGLVERLGVEVLVIPGHEEAFKVTRPIDLVFAEAVLARRRSSDGRS
jgi:2-C-methyl-D-erythritol 4-phosphate cytidylyltransferase